MNHRCKWLYLLVILGAALTWNTPAQPSGNSLLQTPFQGSEVSGASNLRVMVTQPEATEALFTFDYTYDGRLGLTARALAIVDLRSRKGSSAWFGCDPVTIAKGHGTVSIKIKFFNDEEGVPESVITDRVRLLFLNDTQTVVANSTPFLKNITWGRPGSKPLRQPDATVGEVAGKAGLPAAAEANRKAAAEAFALEQQQAKARKDALLLAEAEAKRLAAEKAVAEAKAREEAQARRRQVALEAQLREEAVRKSQMEAARLAEEKAAAEKKAREEEAVRERQVRLEAQLREEALRKAEAESRRLAEEKLMAESKAQEEAKARMLREAQEAKLREEARLKAEAETKRLAEAKAAAEEKALREEGIRLKQAALEAKQRETARLKAEAAIKQLAEEKALAEKQAKERAEEQAAAELKAQETARLKAVAEAKRLAEENARAELAAKEESEARARQAALEAKQREQARIKAEQEAQRLAQEKVLAETKAREEAAIKAQLLALELKQREEARLKAEAESKRLAQEKLLAETKAREEAEARSRQAALEIKEREEARLKVLAEAKRLADEKAIAEKQALEEIEAQTKKEALQAKLRDEALAKAQAEAKRLAAEKAAADMQALEAAKAQTKSPPAEVTPKAAVPSAVPPVNLAGRAPLTASTTLKSKVTNVDVVNRSLDRSRMTFGVEYEYKDDFGPKAEIGLEVLRGNEPESRGFFESQPVEIGKSRRNFLLFPVKFSPTHTLADADQYNTDKVLVYLRDPKEEQKQTMYPATMLLVWRAPGAVAAAQSGAAVEIEDFKQNDPTSGYISLKYNLPANSTATLRVKVYEAAKPESAAYFQPAEVLVKGGRGQQLIDVKVDPDNKSPTDYIKADTIEVEVLGPDKKSIAKVTRKTTMGWARPH